ncbi:hypothetical protein [Bathycoccus sp. RCC716 virus 1]|uniref:Uncharacterized protein n=1 Tax=Bathycoccus sp. RCC716 virus 1 TaxID=2530038 RepID=A0A7S6SWT1_9PHYC|nr:hypothetical protein [Bathycoccus sp. RCC716 virus 1]
MPSTPFVNSSIRTAIPNPCEGLQQILVKVIYENEVGRGPVRSIEAYASPIVSFNYNASYLNRNDMLPTPEDGTIRPISLFNYNRGLWSDSQNTLIIKDYIFRYDTVYSPTTYYPRLRDFLLHIREIYSYDGAITGTDWLCRPPLRPESTYDADLTLRRVSRTVMEIIDKNSENLPEGDYLKVCDELKKIRDFII